MYRCQFHRPSRRPKPTERNEIQKSETRNHIKLTFLVDLPLVSFLFSSAGGRPTRSLPAAYLEHLAPQRRSSASFCLICLHNFACDTLRYIALRLCVNHIYHLKPAYQHHLIIHHHHHRLSGCLLHFLLLAI